MRSMWLAIGTVILLSTAAPLKSTDARSTTIQYTYDAAGRLIKADYGGGKSITYTYDANGNLLSRVAVAGPVVPGDCDGDGTVSIGEVQKAINMFLGTMTPACGVDCSGDGTVSIGEVQKVINGFLGLNSTCP
jgi:YD repeat-containing protein